MRHLLPHSQEDALQGVHLLALDTTVHITPRANHLCTLDVVVSHVHATRIGNLSVDNHNLTVVAVEEIVQPRELHGVELIDLDTALTNMLDMFFLQRLVVTGVTEAVEEGAHLNPFLYTFGKKVEEKSGNGVIPEIEVLQMHTAFRLSDGLEHIIELLLSAHQQGNGIVVRERHTFLSQLIDNQ